MPMTHADFMEFVHQYQHDCEMIFHDREPLYSQPHDRLSQFFDLARANSTNPAKELLDMCKKHWSSLLGMATSGRTDSALWDRSLRDMVNYMILLAAVVRDERFAAMTAVQPKVPRMTGGTRIADAIDKARRGEEFESSLVEPEGEEE